MLIFLLVIIISGVLGAHEFRRVARESPDVGIADIHKRLPYVIPASLIAVGLVILLIASEMYAPLAWSFLYGLGSIIVLLCVGLFFV